jgi:hypothetical protein
LALMSLVIAAVTDASRPATISDPAERVVLETIVALL